METTPGSHDKVAAAEDLAAVEEAQSQLAGDLVVPRGYDLTAGLCAGANVAAAGLVLGPDSVARQAVGVVLFLLGVAGLSWAVRRFRDLNGTWVSGLRRGRTLPISLAGAALQAVLGLATVLGAVAAGWWWLGIVLAPLEVAVFIVVSRRWMDIYRDEFGVKG